MVVPEVVNWKNDLKIERMTLSCHEWVPMSITVPRNQCYQTLRSSQSRFVVDSARVEVFVSLGVSHRINLLGSDTVLAYLHCGPRAVRSPVPSCLSPIGFGPFPEVLLGYCA